MYFKVIFKHENVSQPGSYMASYEGGTDSWGHLVNHHFTQGAQVWFIKKKQII